MEGNAVYLEVKNITKTISNNVILDDISLEMDRGKVYGLRGKNGSGKTMLMRTICGLILPTKGEIVIDGETLGKEISFPRSIGALIESPGFIASYSGLKNLEVLAAIQRKVSTEELAEQMREMGLNPEDNKKFRKYSLGMKQKLGIIAAMMESPDLIVLDEPINALDEKSVETVRVLLKRHKERGALIIISCHDREELELLADEVFCLENGRLTGKYIVEKQTEGDEQL